MAANERTPVQAGRSPAPGPLGVLVADGETAGQRDLLAEDELSRFQATVACDLIGPGAG